MMAPGMGDTAWSVLRCRFVKAKLSADHLRAGMHAVMEVDDAYVAPVDAAECFGAGAPNGSLPPRMRFSASLLF